MVGHETTRNRLLAVIATLLVVAGLKWSFPVTMPLAVAIFVIAATWPVKPWLDRMLPSGLSYIGTILVLLLIFAAFIGALYLAISQAVQAAGANQAQFEQFYNRYAEWAESRGLPTFAGENGFDRLVGIGRIVLSRAYTVLVYLGFVAALVILGLPEVPALRAKVNEELHGGERRELLDTVEQIAARFRRYIGVTTLTSVITGVASGLWALAVGLDHALIWGVLNFLLNFIPIVGNIVGIVPPALYAAFQFGGWTMPLVVFLGYAVIQITISNFVYPWLQGKGLSLSPVVILVALAFWGWVWGIAGALLAVPLTAGIAIACAHFRSTEWVARLLSGRQ